MKRFYVILAAVGLISALGLGTSSQANTISNFSQHPANGGLAATAGVLDIGTSQTVKIDYIFQVPPNAPVPGTVPAALSVTSSSPIGLTALGGGLYAATNVALHFTVTGLAGSLNGVNLLSGDLKATFAVDTINRTISLFGSGSTWTSDPSVLYNVGAGNNPANALAGQTFTMNLLNLNSVTVVGGLLNFTSNTNSSGGSSITGSFAAVPEPASLVLMGLGLAGIPGVVALRKRAARGC